MSNEKSHEGTLLLSEEDDHPMQSKGIDSEDEPKEDPMASGVCRKQKKARSAQVHNFTERIRRRRLQEKMKRLQELVPNCSTRDKASVLDDVVKYIKNLQYQLQMMSMTQGCTMSHLACLMQSPMHHRLPPFPHTRPWGDYETGDGIGISNLAGPRFLMQYQNFFPIYQHRKPGNYRHFQYLVEYQKMSRSQTTISWNLCCPRVLLQVWCRFWDEAFLWVKRIKSLLNPSSPARSQPIDEYLGAPSPIYHTMQEQSHFASSHNKEITVKSSF